MTKYEINGKAIARGNVLERIRALYLVNPVGYKLLLKKQGYEVKTLEQVEQLWADRTNLKNNINFLEIRKSLPVSAQQIAALDKRVVFKNSKGHVTVLKQSL